MSTDGPEIPPLLLLRFASLLLLPLLFAFAFSFLLFAFFCFSQKMVIAYSLFFSLSLATVFFGSFLSAVNPIKEKKKKFSFFKS